ncbi:unnamed protein product [Lactuca virosa]|uniref:Uncharacterized protein n=1 Tax=Lactuca virosa TaxID=75947 RepID=A0AAU9P5C1_9ASTR|nr:unnamed protein product [Lactuca virosa]
MSIVLYSNASTRTFSIYLDDYSPSTTKESQEKDDVQEPNLSSFQQDPLQDDGTPKETDESNTTEPEPERIRLTSKMALSNLEFVYEAKLDHRQNHVTAQDGYISTLEKSIAELSKASTSSSTSPFQAFSEKVQHQLDLLRSDIANLSKSNSEKDNSSSGDIYSLQKTVQLLVDEVKAIKTQSSSSDLCAIQQKVASTDSKLDLILAKPSGSNDRTPEPEGEKSQQNRAKMDEKEKELVRRQGINDPSLKVPKRKDVYFSKPVTLSEPITHSKLP